MTPLVSSISATHYWQRNFIIQLLQKVSHNSESLIIGRFDQILVHDIVRLQFIAGVIAVILARVLRKLIKNVF